MGTFLQGLVCYSFTLTLRELLLSSWSVSTSGTHSVVCSAYTETWSALSLWAREFELQYPETLSRSPLQTDFCFFPDHSPLVWFSPPDSTSPSFSSPLEFLLGFSPLFFFLTRTHLFSQQLVFFLFQYLCNLCCVCLAFLLVLGHLLCECPANSLFKFL